MAWHGKPSGGYLMSSIEGTENIYEMHYILDNEGYTLEAQAGIIGNVYNESALNVWRWQNDTVNQLAGGYGLFQFTASDPPNYTDRYIDVCSWVANYAPNLSTSAITPGARVTDAIAQMTVFCDDILNKWYSGLYRSYWPEIVALRTITNRIISTWGNGSTLTQEQYKRINSVDDAAVAFLGCFEGPAYPNYQVRINSARDAYTILSGAPPATARIPIWLLFKLKEANKRNGRSY